MARTTSPNYAHWRRRTRAHHSFPMRNTRSKRTPPRNLDNHRLAAAGRRICGQRGATKKKIPTAKAPAPRGTKVLEHSATRENPAHLAASLDKSRSKRPLANPRTLTATCALARRARARSRRRLLAGINAPRPDHQRAARTDARIVLLPGPSPDANTGVVVARDLQISHFKPVDLFRLRASLVHSAGTLSAHGCALRGAGRAGFRRRLTDASVAEALGCGAQKH